MFPQSCCAEWSAPFLAPDFHVDALPPRVGLKTMSLADTLSFLSDWKSDPRRVGAIAPSGHSLARLITADIDAGSAPILELGAGTGVFTRALIQRGIRAHELTIVESGEFFARSLMQRFPETRVLQVDAARLRESMLFDDAPLGAVISGLPLLNMSSETIHAIMGGAFAYLRDGGAFYQFTYGWRCPVPREVRQQLGLRATRVGRAWLNLPPAAVWRFVRHR